MIKLTEITSNQGTITKKYIFDSDGDYKVVSAPTVYDGTAKEIELEFDQVGDYLDRLACEPTKCLTLGIFGAKEKKLTTQDKVKEGQIARTKEYFKWANSGSISLLMLDFDSSASEKDRQQFLKELDCILSDSLIGTKESIAKWIRPSTSGSVKTKDGIGNGLHVFIPVKNCNDDLIKLIHKFSWLNLNSENKHKITAAYTVLPESLIDPAVGSAERVVYTADAECTGDSQFFQKLDRKCKFQQGGIIDAEIACEVLEAVTVDYLTRWNVYKNRVSNSDTFKLGRKAWIDARSEDLATTLPKSSKRAAKSLSELILISSMTLTRVGGEKVTVRDILTDPDTWIGVDKFNDPIKQEVSRNVGKIMGTDEAPFLHSFSHGGVRYEMKWDHEDLLDWVETADPDEIEDWIGIHLANMIGSELKKEAVMKKAAERLGATLTAIKKEVKNKEAEKEAVVGLDLTEDVIGETESGILSPALHVSPDASHGDIIDDFISSIGDCSGYGEGIYVWEQGATIWKCLAGNYLVKAVRKRYNHVKRCKETGKYDQLAKHITAEESIQTDTWNEVEGFPCADGFYRVFESSVERVDYSKELKCRFKFGVKPDANCKIPYFTKIVDNIENPVLYQMLFGLALAGMLPKLQVAFIMYGDGGTGKGTTEKILSALLPARRLTSMSLEQMNDEKYVMSLADARLNFTSEVKRKKVDLTGAKKAIANDKLTGRKLFKDPTHFYANCGFVISTNHYFPLSSIGTDIERRFKHSICKFTDRGKGRIVGLADKIVADELPGVLAWAIEGVRIWQEYGLEIDSVVSHSVFDNWVNSVDPIGLFIEECVKFESRAKTPRPEMWKRFKEFIADGGYFDVKKGEFFSEIEKFPRIGNAIELGGVYCFKGVKLR